MAVKLINNDVSERVVEMSDAVPVIEDAFTQLGEGNATFQPRTDIWSPTASEPGDYYRWGSLLGAIRKPPRLALRFKSDVLRWHESDGRLTEEWFNVEPGTYMGFILLFDTSDGSLLGLLNDGVIHHVRVGATAGVGCDYMARADAESVGILGSGGMARSYIEAFAVVRDLSDVKVFSPTASHRKAFAEQMTAELGIPVTAVDTPEKAVTDADIVATCTDARQPVFDHEWLEAGQCVINVRPDEMDEETSERADKVFTTWNEPMTDYVLGSKEERERRPMEAEYRRRYQRKDYATLSDILVNDAPGRESDDETIFYHNQSAGIQFPAVANLALEKAEEQNLGVAIPLEWFQQDIRN